MIIYIYLFLLVVFTDFEDLMTLVVFTGRVNLVVLTIFVVGVVRSGLSSWNT